MRVSLSVDFGNIYPVIRAFAVVKSCQTKLTLGFECSLNKHSTDCGMKNILVILEPVWSGVWPYHGTTVLCVCPKKKIVTG